MNDTIIQTEHWKVSIVPQEYPERPDFDFQGQIIYMDGGRPFTQNRDTALVSYADEIQHAWDRWRDMDLVERYLRIFHDVVGFDRFDTRDGMYINVVTLAELQAWGYESVAAYKFKVGDQDPSAGNLGPWRAWVEGDVYGYTIEEKARYARLDDYDRPILLTVVEQWDEVDSCYGFYGYDNVEQAAREAFAGLVGDPEVVG